MRDRAPAPDQTDTRRPNRDANPGMNRPPERAPGSGPVRSLRSGSLANPMRAEPDRRAPNNDAEPAATGLRWKRPEWLGKPPAPGEIPPVDPAPPTTPRYGPIDSAASTYQPPEDYDPDRERTNYRATSVRAALWASRTPDYEPDQPPVLAERDTTNERAYLESWDTRGEPASPASPATPAA